MDKWEMPYNGYNTSKLFSYKKPGVYLIRDVFTKCITYIGMIKVNAYKALYRHFENWNDFNQYRVVYPNRCGYEVRIILIEREFVSIIEQRLIKYFNPRDNVKHTNSEIPAEFISQTEEIPF